MTQPQAKREQSSESPLVCDLDVFTAQERRRHEANGKKMQEALQEVRELSDGYAFRFPAHTEMIHTLAEFISQERRCCPFFHFGLQLEPDGGPLWLQLRGDDAVKEYIAAEVTPVFNNVSAA